MCVFHQQNYINLLKLLITSISIKANINNETTHILVMTSKSFQPLIQKDLENFDLKIHYYVLDLHTLFEAGCSRLNIFNYENINNYDKILYLDTDILLNSDVNTLFNLELSSEKIYALEEGFIGSDLWGAQFFDFNKYSRDFPAFTSGILFFRNTETMKSLLESIKLHIEDYIYVKKNNIPVCLDQPFIVYNCISQNKYDNQLLKTYVENNPTTISLEKIIYHFPGGPGNYDSKYSKMTYFWDTMNEFTFITLSNSGYIKYTLNCLESLKRVGLPAQILHSYVIGKEGYTNLKKSGYKCTLIDDEKNSNFQEFRTGNWGDITFNKFKIIYENLLIYKYVCFTDGDIVFENKDFLQYLKNNIGTYDILVQSEGNEYEDFCSGFMYIKSTEVTRSIFNPENVKPHKRENQWDDQIYLNEIRKTVALNFKKLPLELFPNGKYYYQNSNLKPYLIHFNWLVGDQKENKMKHYGKWYDKINICQYGGDGFGHQLEGMLRLMSLSLNNKAEYIYDFKKGFTFEHSNFDLKTLNYYLLHTLCSVPPRIKNYELNKMYHVIYNETRSFEDIIRNDTAYVNNIYCYDGVGSGQAVSNYFEEVEELEKSLPTLRKMFVLENPYLPKPSYDNNRINVVCHIRLGDAVGTRILDNDSIINFVKQFQNKSEYKVSIHSNGNIDSLVSDNTVLFRKDTDVLQILSDFIHADILIMNYSSLSIAAHLLADKNQKVYCPNVAGPTFYRRILKKCIKIGNNNNNSSFILNKKYSWQNHSITFFENGQMDAFGKGMYRQYDTHLFMARFGGRMHTIVFNADFTEFTSVRKDDNEIVKGKLLYR